MIQTHVPNSHDECKHPKQQTRSKKYIEKIKMEKGIHRCRGGGARQDAAQRKDPKVFILCAYFLK